MDTFVKAVIGKRRGTLTTIANTFAAVVDDDTGLEYFRTKGLTSCALDYLVTLNDLDVLIDVANEGIDELPERWRVAWWGDDDDYWTVVTDEHTWDWVLLRYDFIRMRVRPNIAAAHGKVVVTVSGASLF